MRIISKFHDYYDIGMSHGQDDDLVYVREIKTIKEAYKRKYEIRYHREDGITYHYRVMGFCGNLIPFVELMVVKTTQGKTEYHTLFAYSKEDVFKVCDNFGFSKDIKSKRKGWYSTYDSATSLGDAVKYLISLPNDLRHLESVFQDHKVPIFYVNMRSYGFRETSFEPEGLILNPCLKDYEFFKKYDPYTAYQELDMYIGGVLGSMGTDVAEVSDKHRFEGHGYDKESFRQPAGRKKPRKKNK